MTGPGHFAKAEEHLAKADAIETDGHDDSMSAWHQRQAAVHATLALAAATALKNGFADETSSSHGRTYMSWWSAAGPASEVTR